MLKFRNKGLLIALILVLSLSVLAIGCGGNTDNNTGDNGGDKTPDKKYIMKFGSVEPIDAVQHKACEQFKEAVEKATDGNVVVELYPASQLGNARAQIEATQMNTQQGVLLPNSNFVGFYPAAAITDLPFLFPNRETTYKIMDGPVGEDYLNAYDSTGMKVVSLWESGFKQFTGNFDITKPGDFKGKKIRVMENPVLIAQYQAMGATATPINYSETYNALQQKVVDGQENPLVCIYDMKFHEVQSCVTISDHGWLPLVVALNKAWYDELPAEYQTAIKDAAGVARDWLRDAIAHEEAEVLIPAFKDSGINVIELTQDQKDAFAAVVKEPTVAAARKILDDNGNALLDEILAEVEKNK
jgi:tripartite ATP-independent transporter DctP family solute receptor